MTDLGLWRKALMLCSAGGAATGRFASVRPSFSLDKMSGLRLSVAYSAASTRVLCGEYSFALCTASLFLGHAASRFSCPFFVLSGVSVLRRGGLQGALEAWQAGLMPESLTWCWTFPVPIFPSCSFLMRLGDGRVASLRSATKDVLEWDALC